MSRIKCRMLDQIVYEWLVILNEPSRGIGVGSYTSYLCRRTKKENSVAKMNTSEEYASKIMVVFYLCFDN